VVGCCGIEADVAAMFAVTCPHDGLMIQIHGHLTDVLWGEHRLHLLRIVDERNVENDLWPHGFSIYSPCTRLSSLLLLPFTLSMSSLPLLMPIPQIKPRITPTNDAHGPDVSRRRNRWGHGHVRHSSSTFPRAW
jgi:hypothetical protein